MSGATDAGGPTSLKAYVVEDDSGDGNICLRFADRNVEARREGANEMDAEFGDVSCRRAPWADSYAPGPVPLQLCIEIGGWWQTCACGCERKIDSDVGQTHYEDDGDDGALNPMAPIYVGRRVYWNHTCKDGDERRTREVAEAKARDQSAAESAVLAKFPFATDIVAFRGYNCDNPGAGATGRSDVLHARFNFPGAAYGATWVIGSPTIGIPPVSADAWKAATDTLAARDGGEA
ncbi:hypothetical protein [Luteimonas terrae]|uniref:DUF3304 domain-containing protein n=1 Tax=Luteimonas terrae TaxID=1530191 RepID=A0ABU1XX98_9GAMM|nr:hypothetical protein [Luteimonas terrae]MDR7193392.1 hypothetical protein [Luteimonas terrae]